MNDDVARAERTLRPTAEQALEAWRTLVEGERAQVERLSELTNDADFYAPMAPRFRDDPRRTDDPTLDLIRPLLRPDETWLDLGAGGGRYALPIALAVERVIAVDPSRGMLDVLRAAMAEEGITNVDVYEERWPGPSRAPQADVGFIAHVGYDIDDIGGFLDQLEQHSRRLCAALLFDRPPILDLAPLWPHVHGEAKVRLPALREFLALLFARGRHPSLQTIMLPARAFDSLDVLHESARRMLWVSAGSPKDEMLRRAIEQVAVPFAGGVALSPAPRAIGLVTWEP